MVPIKELLDINFQQYNFMITRINDCHFQSKQDKNLFALLINLTCTCLQESFFVL